MNFDYQEEEIVEVLDETTGVKELIVFNDDHNTFEHVINTLVKVCRHTAEQAEQCTLIIHYKGKCSVKKGLYKDLKPLKDAICEAGIDAKVV